LILQVTHSGSAPPLKVSGSRQPERDDCGFAMKFYTDHGNWDLVGNNTPPLFCCRPQTARVLREDTI
jgi:hypothetical protein